MRARTRAFFGLWLAVLALFVISAPSGLTTTPANALTAEERLPNPALEDRARALSKQLRCLVCQNQSIDDSDAALAKDLRREVRALLQTGATDAQILSTIQNTYGDYVLLKPPVTGQTWLLWLAPVLIVICGGGVLIFSRRGAVRQAEREPAAEPSSQNQDASEADRPATRLPFGYIAGAVVFMVLTAAVLYGFFGRPDLPDQPLGARTAELAEAAADADAERREQDQAFAAARQAVAEQPDDLNAWLGLALSAARRGDSETEIEALQTALGLSGDAPEIKALLAEAMSRAAGGQVTVPVRALIDDILAQQPDEPRALFLQGLAAYQDEAFQTAIDRWMYLYGLSSADAPWLGTLEENIRRAANEGGLTLPDFAAVRSQMPAADRLSEDELEMVDQMVSQLAERLAQSPDDRDGWLKLARSYGVLGRADEQIEALFRAAALDSTDHQLVIYLAEVILQSGQTDRYAARIGGLLSQIEPATETAPQWQFFRGHFAAAEGDVEQARSSWSALLATLSADSELAGLLQQKIAALPD